MQTLLFPLRSLRRVFRIPNHTTVTRKPSPTHLFYVVFVPRLRECNTYQFSLVLNVRIRFRQPEARERWKYDGFGSPRRGLLLLIGSRVFLTLLEKTIPNVPSNEVAS